jgi:hypothetical protein
MHARIERDFSLTAAAQRVTKLYESLLSQR